MAKSVFEADKVRVRIPPPCPISDVVSSFMKIELTDNELYIIMCDLHARWSEFTREGTEGEWQVAERELGEKLNRLLQEFNEQPEPRA